MENKGLNKVDLIFEKIDSKEVLIKAFSMSSAEIIKNMLDSNHWLISIKISFY